MEGFALTHLNCHCEARKSRGNLHRMQFTATARGAMVKVEIATSELCSSSQ